MSLLSSWTFFAFTGSTKVKKRLLDDDRPRDIGAADPEFSTPTSDFDVGSRSQSYKASGAGRQATNVMVHHRRIQKPPATLETLSLQAQRHLTIASEL